MSSHNDDHHDSAWSSFFDHLFDIFPFIMLAIIVLVASCSDGGIGCSIKVSSKPTEDGSTKFGLSIHGMDDEQEEVTDEER